MADNLDTFVRRFSISFVNLNLLEHKGSVQTYIGVCPDLYWDSFYNPYKIIGNIRKHFGAHVFS